MNYTKTFKIMICISLAVILAGIVVGIFSGGLNIGIDFTGGVLFTIDMKTDYDVDWVEQALISNGIQGAQIIKTGASTSRQTMADIRMKSLDNAEAENAARAGVLQEVQRRYTRAEIISVDKVNGIASATLLQNALLSVAIAAVLILVYVWIRFELYSGISAVLMLVHDVLIMLSIVCIFRIPINSTFIAAVLTIVGYSINNTIVIFDRVREVGRGFAKPERERDGIVNRSVSSSLMRSINTTITTLVTILMVYIFGGTAIREFALPIIVGLIAGAYSSIFLAAPLWGKWHGLRLAKVDAGKSKKQVKNKSAKKRK